MTRHDCSVLAWTEADKRVGTQMGPIAAEPDTGRVGAPQARRGSEEMTSPGAANSQHRMTLSPQP
jgi:hypothetical protein